MMRRFIIAIFPLLLTSCCLNDLNDQMAKSDDRKIADIICDFDIPCMQKSWWEELHSPVFSKAANSLLKQNLDIKIARVRFKRAVNNKLLARTDLMPTFQGEASYSESNMQFGFPGSVSILRAGLNFDWELDLIGSKRMKVYSAKHNLISSFNQRKNTENVLLSQLFLALSEYQKLFHILKFLNQNKEHLEESLNLITQRAQSGLSNYTDVQLSISKLQNTNISIANIAAMMNSARYQVEQLLNDECISNEYLAELEKTSFSPEKITLPDPCEILKIKLVRIKKRPDVMASFESMIATRYDLAGVERGLWPITDLAGFLGAQIVKPSSGAAFLGRQLGVSSLVASNPIGFVTLSLIGPVTNFLNLYGQVKDARINVAEAILNYQSTVNKALNELKTSVSNYANAHNAFLKQVEVYNAMKSNLQLVGQQYTSGLINKIDYNNAFISERNSHIDLINNYRNVIEKYILVQKALGGGC